MIRPSAAKPRSEISSSGTLDSSATCCSAGPRPRFSRGTAQISPWLQTTCTTAAAAKGSSTAGKSAGDGTPTLPCSATKAVPAANPDTACMAPLNSRSDSRWRRKLSTDTAPTRAAPSGPSSTTPASVADELGDQADCRAASGVGVESQIRNSKRRTLSSAQ